MNIELNILNKKLELILWLSTIEDSTILEKIMDLKKKNVNIGGIQFQKMKN